MKRLWFISGPLFDAAGDDGAASGGGGDQTNKGTSNVDKDHIELDGERVDLKELRSARSLFNALRDPETGSEIIKTLAERAGLLDSKGSPKGSEKSTEAKLDSISEKFLKEALGKDYEAFSGKVGPVFDKIVKHFLEEKFGEMDKATANKSWGQEVDTFTNEYTLTEEIEDKMKELMDESPPNLKSKTFKAQNYLKRIYNNAVEELDIAVPKPKKSGRSRRSNDDDEIPDFVVRNAPKDISLDEAIDAATKGIKYKRN